MYRDREKVLEYARKYYWEHKEQRRIYNQQWREDHKEYIQRTNKKWREEHPEYSSESNYRRRYGLTIAEVEAILFAQDSKCKICDKTLNIKVSVVDHDHTTNKIRGILCSKCNTQLAALENKEFFEKAIKYLENYK